MEPHEWQSHRLQGLPENKFRELTKLKIRLRISGADIVDLSEGLPDISPNPRLLSYLGRMALKPKMHRYPTRWGAESLRDEIEQFLKDWFDVKPGKWKIIPVAGTKEAFAHISCALLNPDHIALLPAPGYPIYSVATSYAGANSEIYTLSEEGCPEINKLSREVLEAARLLFLTSPNNPTGLIVPRRSIEETIEICSQHNIVLCQDMAYANLVKKKGMVTSALSIADESQFVLEVHSLSKSLSIPGWRFGFVAGNRQLIEQLELSKSVFDTGLFPLVQETARYALINFREFNEQPLTTYRRRALLASRLLKSYNVMVNPDSYGIFLWLTVNNQRGSGTAFAQQLLQNFNILVMPGAAFRDLEDRHIRVSLTVDDSILEHAIPIIGKLIQCFRSSPNQ